MDIQHQDFIHPLDKKALDALKAIPGFDLVLKKFMSIVQEKMFKIENTSSYLKLGPDQLPEIYNILVKVCKKLQMDIPDLYLSCDRTVNAYTSGDTDPFIVIHVGLLEALTLDQVETVLAHECGHIICHHVLYSSMGALLIDGAAFFAKGLISATVIKSLQLAFMHWMRCSEFSADRVAAYYHGSADHVVDLMMSFAGGTRNLPYKLNREAFFRQAQNYKELIDNSKYNKFLELVQYSFSSHPLVAYRAYEINEFYKNYSIKNLTDNKNKFLAPKPKKEYNLRIMYEFVKPKAMLKMGGIFSGNQLEVRIAEEKYCITKNDTKDIRLTSGKHELLIKNSSRMVKHELNLKHDTSIIVCWDGNEETLTVREES